MKVWDRAGIKHATPGSAVRHVTDGPTPPGMILILVQAFCKGYQWSGKEAASMEKDKMKYSWVKVQNFQNPYPSKFKFFNLQGAYKT